ncbi:MAG: DUF4177 domain-containing protein [Actinobacteria bacterium]|nr:DUF4177 domain-containing protein [Actinomycetota bacterium]
MLVDGPAGLASAPGGTVRPSHAAPAPPSRRPKEPPPLLEYKILTQRDKTFSGAFDSAALEQMLNEHAADGWRLAEGFTAASLWKTMRTEIVLILERPRPETI